MAGRERKRGEGQTRCIVWRETGASETLVRAASSGVHPEGTAVGEWRAAVAATAYFQK